MYVVIVERTVVATQPRLPLIIGPFKTSTTAYAKAKAIRRGFERADLDREIRVLGIDPGSTAINVIVEDAA